MPHHRLPAIAARGALVLLILAGAAAEALAQKVITQASALNGNVTPGDAPGFPVTISQPGTFVLGSDLVLADANTMGIEILGRNVTLDLGGFSIKGPGGLGTGTGIRSTFAAADVAGATVIRNGTVSGVGSNGIDLDGTGSRIDRITVVNTGGDGIVVGPASIVTNFGIVILTDDVTIDLNGFAISGPSAPLASTRGIYAATAQRRITVLNGRVSNFGYGILLTGPHGHIQRIVATGNVQDGIYAGYQGIVLDCTSMKNGSGISMVQGGVVRGNTVADNQAQGVWVVGSSLVVGNSVRSNGAAGLQLDALSGYADNVLTGNNSGGAQVIGGKQLGANVCGAGPCVP
jgi:hypothetical protein